LPNNQLVTAVFLALLMMFTPVVAKVAWAEIGSDTSSAQTEQDDDGGDDQIVADVANPEDDY